LRLFGFADLVLEHRKTANGVGEVELGWALMAAIDRQGFDVATFGQPPSSGVIIGIAKMANSMGKL
jgi:hypothetical protein